MFTHRRKNIGEAKVGLTKHHSGSSPWLPRSAKLQPFDVIASEAKQSPTSRDCFGAMRLAMAISLSRVRRAFSMFCWPRSSPAVGCGAPSGLPSFFPRIIELIRDDAHYREFAALIALEGYPSVLLGTAGSFGMNRKHREPAGGFPPSSFRFQFGLWLKSGRFARK